ncbi:MAG: nickel/cobalt transporter [Paracoccaceae bacterium]
MRLVLGLGLAVFAALAIWFWWSGTSAEVSQWAVAQQREFQNELARGVMAARRGEPGIVWTVILASGLYGFVHALGPGHGKFLIGSAGLASRAQARTMAGLAIGSALAQGLTAVALVYGGLGLLSFGARQAEAITNDILIPASYAMIVAIGAVLVWRGVRGAMRARRKSVATAGHRDHHHHHHHEHDDDCGCGHRHGPTVDEVAGLKGWRDAFALIAAIAVRPCTGAVIVLVIAWQTALYGLGLAAVFAMALGTGAFTALVALASVYTREASFTAGGDTRLSMVAPALQMIAGAVVLTLGIGMLQASLA